jgi:zinc transport system substrate-binding protein
MKRTRRAVLKAGAGVTALGTLAGCLDGPGGEQDGDGGGYTVFYGLQSLANAVGGDEFYFENPVETGTMGHGWSPDGDLTRDIAATRMFLYLDTPEFAWAQDVASELRRDYDDVAVVDAMRGIEPYLIPFDEEPIPEPDHGNDYPVERLVLEEFDIVDLRSDTRLGGWHTGHWHGGVADVLLGESVPVGVVLKDEQERVVPLGEDETYQLDARLADGEPEGIVEIESHGDHVKFHGREVGSAGVVFQIRRGDELVHETAEETTSVEVVEELGGEGADDFHDPHVWIDPVIAERIVERVSHELAAIDPDNATAYEENAAAHADRVMEVHEQFETLAANADKDVAILAGHDSFRYLERRYGFDLRTPTGVSPNAATSFEDIGDLLDIIEANDIDTVLYDPFEVSNPGQEYPQMVQTIFENSDVDQAEPLSPVSGVTEDWAANDWGWVEQMEEVNIPSLRAALDA